MTPLHLCIKNKNYFAIDIFLKMLTRHSFYSHSFNIIDILPSIIRTELPSLKQYLESRVIQTELMSQYKRGAIKTKKEKSYTIQLSNLWPNKQEFVDNFFEIDKLESDVKVMVLDIPKLNIHANKEIQNIFLALSLCKTLSVFEIKTLQYLIDY